jgi:hypothetical protein
MSRFNNTKQVEEKAVNLAGAKAFALSPKVELYFAVSTTFLEEKFYESSDTRIKRIKELVQAVAQTDPQFVAKLAVYTRTELHMRSASHVLISELARIHRGDSLVARAIQKLAIRPDDLTEIVAYLKKPIPNQVKKGIAQALHTFSAMQLAKYQQTKKDVKLVDVFNLTHPTATPENETVWKKFVAGTLKNKKTWEAKISATHGDKEEKKESWAELVASKDLGYMALLRNLRNIEKDADKKTLQLAAKRIIDVDAIKKSKQLPFRFLSAYENVSTDEMKKAINEALEVSLSNVPMFYGKTLIALDISGSMNGVTAKSSIFAAILRLANPTSDLVIYDDRLEFCNVQGKMPLLKLAENLRIARGGTDGSLPWSWAFTQKERYDNVIIISDNESWAASAQGGYEAYKRQTGTDPFVFAIDMNGYGTVDIKGHVMNVAGWSEKVFDMMMCATKQEDILANVEAIVL